jgi:glycosyltransferase involved in cell wall biosynthesis
MNSTHIVFAARGGAGLAAQRFHEMQSLAGFNSEIVVKVNNLFFLNALRNPLVSISAVLDRFLTKDPRNYFFSIFRSRIKHKSTFRKVNSIIHLHWIPGVVSLGELSDLAARSLKVFVHLHDMWFLTGGCHHSLECNQYLSNCQSCPQILPQIRKSVAASKMLKNNFLMKDNVFLIAPSTWMLNKVKFMNPDLYKKCIVVHNPINIDAYKPVSKPLAKKLLSLQPHSLVLGFVATNLELESKGIQKFIDFLESKYQLNDLPLSLLLLGRGNIKSKFNIIKMGHTSNPAQQSLAYSAMDLFINPSKVESFSYTNLEASLHGTPVLTIANGGSLDTLSENVSGYTVNSYDELLSKIHTLINDRSLYERIASSGRDFVIKNFSYPVINSKVMQYYLD